MFVTSGRARMAYEITGVDDGADVLLIHAGVNDRRSWQHVIERLASRHRCIAYDARGSGETTYEREEAGPLSPTRELSLTQPASSRLYSSHPRWAAGLRSTSSWPSPTACLG
jgi:pimeloyl-ACP methyl ester carboxylesterase